MPTISTIAFDGYLKDGDTYALFTVPEDPDELTEIVKNKSQDKVPVLVRVQLDIRIFIPEQTPLPWILIYIYVIDGEGKERKVLSKKFNAGDGLFTKLVDLTDLYRLPPLGVNGIRITTEYVCPAIGIECLPPENPEYASARLTFSVSYGW